ncbi:MAG: hypothetical protein COT00_04590, partial [Candidatus Omnitrophica bacterium CG07_land_8_20_14_0_80_50_8]
WTYNPLDEFTGEVRFIQTDLHPRAYDGENADDLEGQLVAAKERGLGQVFLAISQVKYGLRRLMKRLPQEITEHAASQVLWDWLLLPRTARMGVHINQQAVTSGAISERFEGSGKWILRIFRDRYDIGNPLVEEALFLSMPLHLQYLDSLMYRRYHYDPQTGNIADPRVKNPLLSQALGESMGSLTTPARYGWAKIIFEGDQMTDEELVRAVEKNIWPAYLRLFNDAVKKEERWKGYQEQMKETARKATQSAFDQLTEDELRKLDEYLQSLPEEQKQAIQDQAKKALEELLEQFGVGQEPSQAPPSPGGDKGGKPQPYPQSPQGSPQAGQGEPSLENLKNTMDGIAGQLEALSSEIDQMASGLDGAKQDAKKLGQDAAQPQGGEGFRQKAAKSLESQADSIRNSAHQLLDKGRQIATGADQCNHEAQAAEAAAPASSDTSSVSESADSLKGGSQELLANLQGLLDKTSQLLQSTKRLSEVSEKPDADPGQIMSQVEDIKDKTQEVKTLIGKANGTNRDLERTLHELQSAVQDLQDQISGQPAQPAEGEQGRQNPSQPGAGQPAQPGAGQPTQLGAGQPAPGAQPTSETQPGPQGPAQPGAGQPAQPGAGQPGPGTSTLPGAEIPPSQPDSQAPTVTPDVLHMENVPSLEELLKEGDRTPAKSTKRAAVKPFNFEQTQREEEEAAAERTGLNQAEREEYESWLNIKIQQGQKEIRVRQLIEDMTEALKVLTLPSVDIEFKDGLLHGPILSDIVAAVIGDPAYGKWVPSQPLPVKFTFVVDTSGSMGSVQQDENFRPIDIVRIIVFAMANAFFDHNEERERKGFDPIEFELAFFADDEGRTQITHETVRTKAFKRERFLFNVWKGMEAKGKTYYAHNLHKYTERLLQSLDRGELSTRILMALTDEDVKHGQKESVLATIAQAEEEKAHIFIVPLGNKELTRKTVRMHKDHPERVISARPLAELPYAIMLAFMKTLEPPSREADWTQTAHQGARLAEPSALNRLKAQLAEQIARIQSGPPPAEQAPNDNPRQAELDGLNHKINDVQAELEALKQKGTGFGPPEVLSDTAPFSRFAQLIKQNHKESSIHSVFSYELNGVPHFVSVGGEGKAF